jgi:dipeptidase E
MTFSKCLLLLIATTILGAPQRKIYAAGSGQDMMSLPETVQEVIALSGKKNPRVLYLGTATYDEMAPQWNQTQAFIAAGCSVNSLAVAVRSPSIDQIRATFAAADIVLVSGGNTLFARDRWMKLGMVPVFQEALNNGTVMSGGSAGGIVWFDAGHSDSMQPESFKNPPGPFLNPNMTQAEMENWAYIRCPGLSLVPSLFCPHYDMTEDNGVLRSADFTKMLQRHSGETGVGVDNWGALVIDGDRFSVISRKGYPGSDLNGNFTPNRTGIPAVWQMSISPTGELSRTLVSSSGAVSDLLRPAKYVVDDSMLSVARGQNPDDGIPPSVPLFLSLARWVGL